MSDSMREEQMKPACREKKVKAQKPLDCTLDCELYDSKGRTGLTGDPQPRTRGKKDDAILRASEDRKLNARGQSAEDVEADQILGEFFSALEAGDLSENLMGLSGSLGRRSWEERPGNKTDAFNELLEDMESIERAVTEETRESHSTAAEAVATVRLREADWAWSDIRHPRRIPTLGRKIGDVRAQEEDFKRRHQDIRSLLCASGNQLKRAVVRVFRIRRNL
jgi:hypothetical protein